MHPDNTVGSSRKGKKIQPAIAADPSSLNAGVGPGLTNTRKRMRLKAKLIIDCHDGRLDRVT